MENYGNMAGGYLLVICTKCCTHNYSSHMTMLQHLLPLPFDLDTYCKGGYLLVICTKCCTHNYSSHMTMLQHLLPLPFDLDTYCKWQVISVQFSRHIFLCGFFVIKHTLMVSFHQHTRGGHSLMKFKTTCVQNKTNTF
jgi:hypothetical protein